jgi:hypothetical protein
MKIKTALKFHLTPVRILSSRTPPTTNVDEDVEEKEPSYTAGGKVS